MLSVFVICFLTVTKSLLIFLTAYRECPISGWAWERAPLYRFKGHFSEPQEGRGRGGENGRWFDFIVY